jgi:hypothetical protein
MSRPPGGDSVAYRYDEGRSYANLLGSSELTIATIVLTTAGVAPLPVEGAVVGGEGIPASPSLAATSDCCLWIQLRLWNPGSAEAELPELVPTAQYLIARAASGNPYFVYNVVLLRGPTG